MPHIKQIPHTSSPDPSSTSITSKKSWKEGGGGAECREGECSVASEVRAYLHQDLTKVPDTSGDLE